MNATLPAAKDAPAFAQVHAALLRHSEIQFAFPHFVEPAVPDWFTQFLRFLGDHRVPIKWALWGLLGLGAVAVAVILVRQYWPKLAGLWRRQRAEEPAPAPNLLWRPSAAHARQLLRESDALAAEGRYSEAVHLILLRSIEDIAERRPRAVRPTLTSREIGGLPALPEDARAAFAPIVRVVERARFRGETIGQGEFEACRRQYESFAFAGAWQAPR